MSLDLRVLFCLFKVFGKNKRKTNNFFLEIWVDDNIFYREREHTERNAYGKGEDVISDNLQLIMVQSQ